jgi:membrane protein DedA with SNARE-associated domain
MEWLAQFTAHAVHIVSVGDAVDLSAGFAVAFLTELGIPFPLVLDTILFLLGYQIQEVWVRAIAVVLGLLLAREAGAAVLFWLAHSLGHPLLEWVGRRFPAVPRRLNAVSGSLGIRAPLAVAISRLSAQAPLAVSGFALRAPLTIALSRLTPGLLTVTSLASGTLRFKYRYFVAGIAIASIFADSTVIALGVITGYGLRQLSVSPPPWLLVIGIVINLIVVLAVQRAIWRHAMKRSNGS